MRKEDFSQSFAQLYLRVLKETTGKTKFVYDAKQLKSLFHPAVHKPYWKLDEIMTEDNKTLDGKPISKDVAAVLRALAKQGEQQAFCLVAPAFRGQFSDLVTPGMMRTAFKSIGFDGFIEIAVFADILTLREALEFERNIRTQQDYMLTSCCCPMWLAMIRKLYSCLMPHVPASVSPMIAAGRVVKKLHPGALTVFIGPCLAKKAEAREPDVAGAIDYVLTFKEIKEMFNLLQVDLMAQDDMVREYSSEAGRIYARAGGVSDAVNATIARISPHRRITVHAEHADGVAACKEMIDRLVQGKTTANFFEGMGCKGGCVGGPRALLSVDDGRERVNSYGDKALYRTPLDNPYVLDVLYHLGFTTLQSLLDDKEMFVRTL